MTTDNLPAEARQEGTVEDQINGVLVIELGPGEYPVKWHNYWEESMELELVGDSE